MKRVSFVGFEIFDSFEKKKIDDKIEGLINKFKMHFGNENLNEVKIVYKTLGSKDDHTGEVKFTMNTNTGTFRSEKIGHKVLETVDEIVNDINRQITTKKEKAITSQRPRNA